MSVSPQDARLKRLLADADANEVNILDNIHYPAKIVH